MRAQLVLITVALVATAAFLLFAFQPLPIANYAAAIMLGFVLGAEMDFIAFFAKRYFPPDIFGGLYGLMFLAFTLGGGIGPLVMGLSFDRLGSYHPALLLLTLFSLSAACLAFLIPPAGKPDIA